MIWRIVLTLGIVSGFAGLAAGSPPTRLVVLTDVNSLTTGVGEPDDGQSLVRLMLYANEFDIEGLVASSGMRHGHKNRPDLIRRVIDAYDKVRPNLLKHDPRYPPAEALREVVKAGQPIAGPGVAVERCVGEGKDTEASDWLIRVVDRPDPRPVRVIVWGGSADLAQALWKVRRDRSADDLRAFLGKLRVLTIGDQDATGPWIREQFPGLPHTLAVRCYRGMYRGGDPALVSSEWVGEHVHGRGALGDLYPDYDGGDIWSARLGRVRGIKEGDSPSLLALVPNGLTDLDRPWLGSWGGIFEGPENRLTDVPDPGLIVAADPDPRMSSVHRWRPAFQGDFQARLDWCVKPFAACNHPPVVRIAGDRVRSIAPGPVELDAGASTDPDGQSLDFAWSLYPASPEVAGKLAFEPPDAPRTRVVVPPDLAGRTIPVLLAVTDRGSPNLARYGRVLLRVGR